MSRRPRFKRESASWNSHTTLRMAFRPRSSRRADLVVNVDGSIDICVGPKAVVGFEHNWIPSVPGRTWFCYFRLYAPTQVHFDKAWTLPDFELVK
ncbi:MAG TPA: DUF1214 domain-containing protein [Planctomycetes bacterium]|nr:DUF1214 domain-containing protein [Planctomycetaceae bacterium]HIM31363.1 DUF1214 domain-containing protein [Planctomycetota bacterium]